MTFAIAVWPLCIVVHFFHRCLFLFFFIHHFYFFCLSLGVVWPLSCLILRSPSNPTANTDPLWCFTKLGLEPQPPLPSPPFPFVAFTFSSPLCSPSLLYPPLFPPFPLVFPVATPRPSVIVRWVGARILVLAPHSLSYSPLCPPPALSS